MESTFPYETLGHVFSGLVAGLFVFFILMVLICLALTVLYLIGFWKILEKGNKPGWGALIPIYNTYLLCQIVGVNPWWILIVFIASLLSFIPIIGSLIFTAASIYFTVILNISLARSFKKDDVYALGLIFLQPIFYLILGYGESKYEGPKPMDDFVMNFFNKHVTVNVDKNTETCPECGEKISSKSKYCPKCGKEIK